MRSGDPNLDRNSEYAREVAYRITDREFSVETFHPYPALLSREPVRGARMWKPYQGGDYDQEEFELVEGMWDHEHCSVCNFKITAGQTYWVNAGRVDLICDECHEFYIVQRPSSQARK